MNLRKGIEISHAWRRSGNKNNNRDIRTKSSNFLNPFLTDSKRWMRERKKKIKRENPFSFSLFSCPFLYIYIYIYSSFLCFTIEDRTRSASAEFRLRFGWKSSVGCFIAGVKGTRGGKKSVVNRPISREKRSFIFFYGVPARMHALRRRERGEGG